MKKDEIAAAMFFFENNKRIFSGINAGQYIDKEDFEIFAKSTQSTIIDLHENLKRIIDRIEEGGFQLNFPSAYNRAVSAIEKANELFG